MSKKIMTQQPNGAPVPAAGAGKHKNAPVPEGSWAITAEDKPKIREFGRALTSFVENYAKEKKETLEMKIIAGGFQYFVEVQTQLGRILSDDFTLSRKVMAENGLGDKINEPFEDTPVEDASIEPEASKNVPGPDAPEAPQVDQPLEAPQSPEAPEAPQVQAEQAPAAPSAADAPSAPEAPVQQPQTGAEAPLPPTA